MRRAFPFVLLALATILGNTDYLAKRIRYSREGYVRFAADMPYSGNGASTDAPRAMLERNLVPGDAVFYATDLARGLSSMDRAVHQALIWVVAPAGIRFGGLDQLARENVVVVSGAKRPQNAETLAERGFHKADKVGRCELWRRLDGPRREDLPWGLDQVSSEGCLETPVQDVRTDWPRELMGLMPIFAVFLIPFCVAGLGSASFSLLLLTVAMAVPLLAGCRPSACFVLVSASVCGWTGLHLADPNRRAVRSAAATGVTICLGVAFFAFLAWITLSHSFTTTNALGVYGGKAKMLFLGNGYPDGFFSAAGYETLQPAYPPGFVLAILGINAVGGGCGEWLTQLLSCFFMASCLVACCTGCRRRVSTTFAAVACQAWVLGAFLAEPAVAIGNIFYPESMMLLFLLAGWERIKTNALQGWILLGACGWVKTEGLALLFAAWLAVRLTKGANGARLSDLLAAAVLPVSWFAFSRIQGGGAYDYAPVWDLDARQAFLASKALLSLAFLTPWKYGFAYCGLLLPPVHALIRRRCPSLFPLGELAAASLFVCAYAVALVIFFALSRAPDFRWHLQSAERLLWPPSFLMILALTQFLGSALLRKTRKTKNPSPSSSVRASARNTSSPCSSHRRRAVG